MFMANRRSPLLYGRHRGLPLLHGRHGYMADTVVCPYYMADTRVCPYHSLIAVRYSLIANRQSLPFSVVANSLMADTRGLPLPFANRHSLFAAVFPVASR
jgi:hypothetical protein